MFACLLHDIGKALDRAYTKNSGTYLGVDMQGAHPVKGSRWIEAHRELFSKVGLNVEVLKELVIRHHDGLYGGEYKTSDAPKELLKYCKIVSEADNLSSANTRYGAEKTGASDYHLLKDLLTTSYVTASGNKVVSQVDAMTGKKTQLEALSLVNNFDAEVSKLTETDVNTLYDRVTELVYKYLYYINPATNSKDADAGLWDHSSTTAGIGNCMYVNLEESDKYKKSDVYMLKVEMQDSGFESLSEYDQKVMSGRIALKSAEMDKLVRVLLESVEGTSTNILSKNQSVCYLMVAGNKLDNVHECLVEFNKNLLNIYKAKLIIDWEVAKYDFEVDFHTNMSKSKKYNGSFEVYLSGFGLVQARQVKAVRCKYCGAVGAENCKVCEKAAELGSEIGRSHDVMAVKVKVSNFNDVLTNKMADNCTISRVSGYFKRVGEELDKVTKALGGMVIKQTEDSVYMLISATGKTYGKIKSAVDSFNESTGNLFKCRVATRVYKNLYKADILTELDNMWKNLDQKDKYINIYTLTGNWNIVPMFTTQFNKFRLAIADEDIGNTSLYKASKYYEMMVHNEYECIALVTYEIKKSQDKESKQEFFTALRKDLVEQADVKQMLKLRKLALEVALRED